MIISALKAVNSFHIPEKLSHFTFLSSLGMNEKTGF